MDSKQILFIGLAFLVIGSGCTEQIDNIMEPEEGSDDWDTPDPEKGVSIDSLELSTNELRAIEDDQGERAEITLLLSNYHTETIELEDVEIFNTGLIELEDDNREANCNTYNLEAASSDTAPQAECTWVIYGPGEDDLDSAGERTQDVIVSFSYDASFTNQQPIDITFDHAEEITDVRQVQESFTNSEIQMVVETNTPTRTGTNEDLDITLREGSAPGQVVSDYSLTYEPERLIEECPTSGSPQINSELEVEDCYLFSEDPIQDSLTITADYKYEQSETLSIPITPN